MPAIPAVQLVFLFIAIAAFVTFGIILFAVSIYAWGHEPRPVAESVRKVARAKRLETV
ncbi:MAG TPA: hypothetical protein VGS12_15430 [Caulobacteraceae bacterium]|nr:hypothetical protein [Caulobacteraceae bacterium]